MKHFAKNKWVVILVGVLLGANCSCGKTPEGYKEVYSAPTKPERLARFEKLPMQDQVNVYVYAVSHREPPDTTLVQAFVDQRSEAVPAIVMRIELDDNERTKVLLLEALESASLAGVKIGEESVTINRLRSVSERIKDKDLQSRAQKSLQTIGRLAESSR